ncbi:MAG: hypothetical protein AB8B93_18335 [Pseudomonadales bacterium]
MIKLEQSARRHAIGAGATSVGFYSIYTASWFFNPEVGFVVPFTWVAVSSLSVPILVLLFIPIEKVADLLASHLQPQPVGLQFENVVSEIAVALAEPVESIQSYASPVPNVLMLPCSEREVVVATTGALELLNRHELQATVAAQFAGMRDPWCRLATRAEMMWWAIPGLFLLMLPALLFGFVAAGMASFLAIFVWAFAPRWIEQARDLCADVAAVKTTFDPQALASAMRKLAEQAHVATSIKFAKFYLPTNPFQVIPRRVESTTTVSSGGKSRRWHTSDEVRLELLLRADRAEALAQGADPDQFTGNEFRRRWQQLGEDET